MPISVRYVFYLRVLSLGVSINATLHSFIHSDFIETLISSETTVIFHFEKGFIFIFTLFLLSISISTSIFIFISLFISIFVYPSIFIFTFILIFVTNLSDLMS